MSRIAKLARGWVTVAMLAGCGQLPVSVTGMHSESTPVVPEGQQPAASVSTEEPAVPAQVPVKTVKPLAIIQQRHEAFIKSLDLSGDQELRIRALHANSSAKFLSAMQPHLEKLAVQLSTQPIDAPAIQTTLEECQALCRQQVNSSIEMLGQIREILTDAQLTKAIRFLRSQTATTDIEQMSVLTSQLTEILKLNAGQASSLEALVSQGRPGTLAQREQLNQAIVTFFQTGDTKVLEQSLQATMPARSVVPSVAFISALEPIQRQSLVSFVKEVLTAHQEALSSRS